MHNQQTKDTKATQKSILIVDDESDVRTVLNILLAQCGYAVTEAADGQEALDLMSQREFDLVFLDLMMPRLTGEEVLERMKADGRLARLPVIVLTAVSQRKDVKRGYEKGASFYVVKPFNNKTIQELARYFLEDMSEEEKEKFLSELLGTPDSPSLHSSVQPEATQ